MTNATHPLVTIAIPTFNRADGYLRDALQSAVAQTYSNLEIIVSDNGSSDHTAEVVTSFDDPRIRYLRHERNIGAINNWNGCVQEARGRYFLLIHDDDLIDPDFVAACMQAATSQDVGLIRTGTRVIDSRGRTVAERRNEVSGETVADLFLSWFAGKTSFYLCSTLYHTERLKEIGGFKSKKDLLLDVVAIARLAGYGWVDVKEVKASFRRHEGNMGSAARIGDWAEDSRYLLDVVSALEPEREAELRRAGLPTLCRQNYSRVARIGDWRERWRAYWLNFKAFEYVVSPLAFLYRRQLRSLKAQLKRALQYA